MSFDPRLICEALNAHGVRYVVVGGFAAVTTDHGDLDLTFEPAGPRIGFDDWQKDPTDVEIANGLVVRIASLCAVIDSKRARRAREGRTGAALPGVAARGVGGAA